MYRRVVYVLQYFPKKFGRLDPPAFATLATPLVKNQFFLRTYFAGTFTNKFVSRLLR